jgi:hypothetical protein
MSEEIREIKVEVCMVKCPRCGRRIYGLTEGNVKEKLIEHLNVHCVAA